MVPLRLAGGRVRSGEPRDLAAIRTITEAVFSVFGEYGSWLPGYLGHPGVWTFVHEDEGEVRGFAMLGLLEAGEDGGRRICDLLAIAVGPDSQGRGVGRALLERAVATARGLAASGAVDELRLTVAEPNERARLLFRRAGFQTMDGDHGWYERGQRALRLRLELRAE